ncbi:Fc.00g083870.m01.CDS01 [Cosmosporella sp. VM-42]
MAQNEVAYKYIDLKNPNNNIRLLTVIADDFNTPLRSRLEEVSFKNAPKYIALSYVWGSPESGKSLQIDNRILSIQPNIFDALRRFRAVFGAFTIWIDAICINQSNLDERSAQVSIMRIIYESAGCVFVYFGEDDEAQQLQSLFDSLIDFIPVLASSSDLELDWNQLSKYGLPDVLSSRWHQFVRFLEHPWFLRAWVFQEILVAKESIFILGDCKINQVDLFMLLHVLITVHHLEGYIDRTSRMRLSPMVEAAQRCTSIISAQGPVIARFIPQTWTSKPLIALLRQNITSKATDPRDHVFAFLGVSNEADEPELQPDYKEEVDDTYKRVGRYMAERGFTPLLLECTTRTNPPDWPSWIPRWHETGNHTFMLGTGMRMSSLFTAAGKSIPAFQCQADYALLAHGIIVDTISRIGGRHICIDSLERLESAGEGNNEVMAGLIGAFLMLYSSHQYLNSETMSEVLYRLLVCDQQLSKAQKAPKEYHKGLAVLLNAAKKQFHRLHHQQNNSDFLMAHLLISFMLRIMPELALQNDNEELESRQWALEFLRASFKCCSRLVRYTTAKGYIGQAIPDVKLDDKVALLQGCDVPLILRPIENGTYTYISTCYLHGVMYGEAWNEEKIHTITIV